MIAGGFSPLSTFTISKLWRIQIWPSINNDYKISRFKLHFSSITNNKYRGSHYIKNNGVDMRKCDATKKRSIGWNEKIDRWLCAGILQHVLFLCNDQWLYLFNTSKSDSAKNSFSNYQRQYKSRMIYVSISEYVVLILEIEVQVWKNTTENLISKKTHQKTKSPPPPKKKNSLQGLRLLPVIDDLKKVIEIQPFSNFPMSTIREIFIHVILIAEFAEHHQMLILFRHSLIS